MDELSAKLTTVTVFQAGFTTSNRKVRSRVMKLRSILMCGPLIVLAAPEAGAGFQVGHGEKLIRSTNPGRTVFQARVAYGDLDLRSSTGVGELRARVRRAAGQVCGAAYRSERGTLAQRGACWRQTVQAADPEIAAAVREAWTIARK
jgi:UrcA family protein